MAPTATLTDSNIRSRHVSTDHCAGWDCLSDAGQLGVIVVVVAVLLALGYLYWRLQLKPDLRDRDGTSRRPITGQWEVTRRSPNRVSITIYREPRPVSDPEAGETDGQPPERNRRGSVPAPPEDHPPGQVSTQLAPANTSEVHLAPPPPPPVFLGASSSTTISPPPPPPPPVYLTAASPSTIPPPPPFPPPSFFTPSPGLAPPPPDPHAWGRTGVSYLPEAPPPYFGYPAPQFCQPQAPGFTKSATSQAAFHHPLARTASGPSAPPRNRNEEAPDMAQPAEKGGLKKRWFSFGARFPPVGHARTLSNTSTSTVIRRSSPSPPPPSVSSHTEGRERSQSRRPSASHQSAQRDRQTPAQTPSRAAQNQHRSNSPSPSESSVVSSYVNTSQEVVYDTQRPHHHHRARGSSDSVRPRHQARREVNRPQTRRGREDRAPPPESYPLTTFRRTQPLSTTDRRRRRPPSPDLQFPSPESRRARVSFSVPRGSDEVSGGRSSESSVSSSEEEEDRRRGGGRRGQQRRRREGGYHGGGGRELGAGYERERAGLVERVRGVLGRVRRALRGED